MKLTWREVFDSWKLKENTFDECAKIVKKVGYTYINFNGYVYSVYDSDMKNPICTIDEL